MNKFWFCKFRDYQTMNNEIWKYIVSYRGGSPRNEYIGHGPIFKDVI